MVNLSSMGFQYFVKDSKWNLGEYSVFLTKFIWPVFDKNFLGLEPPHLFTKSTVSGSLHFHFQGYDMVRVSYTWKSNAPPPKFMNISHISL
jgi:hypothetical protein